MAENYMFRLAQCSIYADEIAVLKAPHNQSRKLLKNSPLRRLCTFLDKDGILRSRGRTQECHFADYDAANPIILPPNNHITKLIVLDAHKRFNHQNHETIINEVRQRFCSPGLKATYRAIRKSCQHCKNEKAAPQPPAMADLPYARLAAFCRPFTYMGIDYFGPMIVSIGRRTEKRWGVIATCLTTRAIHLELAHTLTTSSCIMAIRNIFARRGIPAVIYSDRGTNFQGASKEMQTALEKLDHDQLMQEFTTSRTEWKFNPPASPHMGGAWERLIQSVKKNLNVLQRNSSPTHEVLQNALVEVENVLNSRPLTSVPLDNDESPVLTPNHFLLGTHNGLRPWTAYDDSSAALRNTWQRSQIMANQFWKQWIRDYLPTLTRRQKWLLPAKPIAIGDVVIIVDSNLPRNCWLKGRVIGVKPNADGQVRMATVQTTNGIYERPAVKLAVLDVGVQSNTLQLSPQRILGGV
ncbi:uncharacterized protein LOC131434290 [Malaya genurostris]|uniref:uncharacterized protein LOC131434290 n=1 Tax=Malaya genurostris TaxID=325434 RepID=UPI0026F3E34B|nr:uncharacterized protein LOC131434290 [Malaya genurostris]